MDARARRWLNSVRPTDDAVGDVISALRNELKSHPSRFAEAFIAIDDMRRAVEPRGSVYGAAAMSGAWLLYCRRAGSQG